MLVAAALPVAAAAQSNAERMTNDAYTRSHDYDLIHQRIALRDFDWDSTSFVGRVTTTLVALRPAFDSVVLDAGSLLHVDGVRDTRGRSLRSASHGDTLVVYLARPVAFRDTARFTIDYHGRVRNGNGLTFIRPDGLPHRPQQIWSQGEDIGNHKWFPTYDAPNDKMTWELIATVPQRYTVVSNGRLVSDQRNAHGMRTMSWSQESPSATYLVSVIIAPLVRIHDSWHGVPVDYYVYADDSARAWRTFHVTPDMIDVYSTLTGVKYPWAKYAQTTVADFFGGMENVSATTLVDWLPDGRAFADRPWYQWILIPHELAHQWFGDDATTVNWANMWLNEGFAEFMPGQYWERKLGTHVADDYYLDEYDQFMSIDARRRMPLASLESNNIYPKGALVLRMLQHYLGPDRFWASIHAYLTRHNHANATTDDLRQSILRTTGENLDWFFSEWMYQAGYPEFDVSATYDTAASRLTLSVRQVQEDTSHADSTGLRYTTPAVFTMPVVIRVATTVGDIVRRVTIDQREQTIVIDGVASPPTMVVFDDGDAVLKKLSFEQPTAWLATQLQRDPNLWNRWWVIQQLARRTTDTTAGRALAATARSADYSLTRAQAATALDSFPASLAQPALVAALRDTSSAVRAAALEALGTVGGADALSAAQRSFSADTSYHVRAAALAALVRLDSADRRTTIETGLRTPSYRDEIQNAALAAIQRTGDTSFVGAVDGLTGAGILPAFTLGSLAADGNAHALSLLTGHLNDSRSSVRQWAAIAIARQVRGARAMEALTAARPTITYPDTQRLVDQLLKQHGSSGH